MNFFYKILTLPPYIKGKNFIVMFDVMFLLLISKDKKIVKSIENNFIKNWCTDFTVHCRDIFEIDKRINRHFPNVISSYIKFKE